MDSSAKWITSDKFYELEPKNVFSKENKKIEKEYDEDLLNSHILFRKKFTVIKSTNKYTIHISADDYYRLYINGKFVASGPAPSYPWHYWYNTIDITDFLTDGTNTIAVHTYYQGLINRVWVSGDRRHGLICQIFENDIPIVSSDESFKCQIHSAYRTGKIAVARHDTLFCEIYDSNSKETDFYRTDFDDSQWENSKIRKNIDYKLFEQKTKCLDYYIIKPQKITKKDFGWYIDIGQEIVGYITMAATGVKGSTVIIRYGEELDENERVRYIMRCNCTYEDNWILCEGISNFSPFDYKGFRYIEILDDNHYIDEKSISIIVRHYPFKPTIDCPINDSEIQKIWTLCKNTIKYGTQECFVDCPTREKGQYLGDVTISSVANAILTGKAEMLKKSILDFAYSSPICKGLMAVSTSSFMQEIADFSLLFPMAQLWYHKLTGDTELLKELLPITEGLADYFKMYERQDGLITSVTDKWNLVDWPENLRDNYDFPLTRPIGDGCHNVINAFYIGMLKCVNKIHEICGLDITDITDYESAFINEFYNKETNLFVDCKGSDHSALHSNVLPLFFNIGIKAKTKNAIVDLITTKGLTCCGTYFSFFVLQSLKNANQTDLIINMVKAPGTWLNMLKEGATTTYEAWGKNQKKNTSLFHPWSCSPILILYDI